ncbi:glycosyltransferase family 4 protein [Nitratiruptor sp. YY09-18]|uniref:glycosyltransferase family 4 protein n=1 Tax=Nitratiruptor sp. YY09-18 TaxID=2724901 RepID=UPI001914DEBC|nr:glycosyltransferase family 4 protein [Nitratiruptor sp. YY09-18]BCD67622.1 glycosyl transferase [Nitratiruptor sp. YY09-18]
MRIVQLLPELNQGGVERGVVELSRELVRRGHESIVISAGGKLVKQIEADGGRHIQFDVASKNIFTVPSRIAKLRKIFAKIQPDIIHVRSRVPAWLSFFAKNAPFVTTVHGFNSINFYSKIMTRGDRVICVSNPVKEYVVEHYKVDEQKIRVIHRGIDLELFNPASLDREFMEKFSAKFDLAGKFVITTVGRITQLKDYETFIEAVTILRKKRKDLKALIVGGVHKDKQDYFASLQQLVAQKGLEKMIEFCGSQSKIAEIYALSDVVVSSSKKPESFGRSIAEAMAMNTPVVAPAHGGALDICKDGYGALFLPSDAQDLAQKIEQVEPKEGMRDYIARNFSLHQMVEKTLEVYKELC